MNETGVQWENENALRKYPLNETATCVDDFGKIFPFDLITGLSVVSFSKLENLRVASVYAGPFLTSVVLSDDSGLVATATMKETRSFEPIRLESMRDGVSGYIEFGERDNSVALACKFSTAEQSGILPFCIVDFPDSGITAVVDDVSGKEITGDIVLNFGNAVVVSTSISEENSDVKLSLSDSVSRSLSTGCAPTDLNKSCVAPVIQTINGVSPDKYGTIAFVFE